MVQSSDAAHFVVWKRDGLLAPYVPEDVAKHYPAEHKDADGHVRELSRLPVRDGAQHQPGEGGGRAEELRDLLDPKWAGKIVKAHPGYSGTILTATYQIARDIGWDYFEKLAKQSVMQVQSASDPPKKLALGERAIMADGIEYGMFQLKETGKPVDVIYPAEGTPLIIGPNGMLKSAPNPNAARLLQNFMLSARMPAVQRRVRRLALGARAGQGQARPQADDRDQGHEGRRRRGGEGERARSRSATRSSSRCEARPCREQRNTSPRADRAAGLELRWRFGSLCVRRRARAGGARRRPPRSRRN